MSSKLISRRYAQSFYLEAQMSKSSKGFMQDMQLLVDLAGKDQYVNFFIESVLLAQEEKEAVWEKISQGMNDLFKQFIFVLIRAQRLYLLPEIFRMVNDTDDVHKGLQRVYVTSSHSIDTSTKNIIIKNVAHFFRIPLNKLRTAWKTNASLIGGVVVRRGNQLWDGSLRKQLTVYKNALKQ